MENVWKIGSRWSEHGSWNSRIISIFRRSEVVFLGNKATERFKKEVEMGDYFAIADGYHVSSVAKVVSIPKPLNDMIAQNMIKVRPDDPFNIDDDYSWCYGVKVKIVDLPEKLHFTYKKRGTFFKANTIAKKVIRLYEDNLSTQFDIKARTYRIMSTRNKKESEEKCSIIDNRTIFNIPIYQREYSWGREQITKFVCDIFKGFWGIDEVKNIHMEPMFIGTMQLSYKKHICENEYEQDVIDGQQRLSTILCILKFLKLRFPNVANLQKIPLNWLETRVNNGKEYKNLSDMLALDNLDEIQKTDTFVINKYLENIQTIKEIFDELTKDENGQEISLFYDNIQKFIQYFLNDIYFVVVETLAGLSKTIQIFNTINTAGLDLNGNDLFKVRFYEYLHDKKNMGEEAFNEIGEIYKEIKEKNDEWRKKHNWDVITIDTVRSIYKYYIISKYKLRTSLYAKSTDTFFDELFDTLLNVQTPHDYVGIKDKGVELSISDLRRIYKIAYLWNSSEHRTSDEFFNYTLIERSRYSRYTNIAYQILLSNENLPDVEERLSEVYELLARLSRLFFCYSVKYAKAVNEIHSFMYKLYQYVYDFHRNKDLIFSEVNAKIKSNDNDWFRNECLGEPIAWNRIWKDLICLLSDYLDEKEQGTPLEELQNLFTGSYDIEHIHANANEDEGTDISEELQNSIGNLMLLEYDINRSIGCRSFAEKVNRVDGGLCYKDSKYATVKRIMNEKEWTLEEVIKRRKEEIDKISQFLFM